MPKTISKNDPHLLEAVRRLDRTQKTTGGILIAYGLLTQFVGIAREPLHPVAGLAFIALGFFEIVWGDPALLATAAVLLVAAILPSVNPRLTLLGPDPFVQLTGLNGWELLISVAIKAMLALTALQQFFMFRLLYGTERATSDEPDLAVIPPMVPNRTDRLARWGRSSGVIAVLSAVVALGFLSVEPQAAATRMAAELAGALGMAALALGLGAAFSPTDERPAALTALGLGLAAYLAAAVTLLRLP